MLLALLLFPKGDGHGPEQGLGNEDRGFELQGHDDGVARPRIDLYDRTFLLQHNRRVVDVIPLMGNDDPVDLFIRLLDELECKINLIGFNQLMPNFEPLCFDKGIAHATTNDQDTYPFNELI